MRFLIVLMIGFQLCFSQNAIDNSILINIQDTTWEQSLPIKRKFNHKQQVITAGSMMTAFVLMLFTINNFNPK